MKTHEGGFLTVIVGPETRFPLGADIKENDAVVVFGKDENGTINAFGIRKVDDDIRISPLPRSSFPLRHLPAPFPRHEDN